MKSHVFYKINNYYVYLSSTPPNLSKSDHNFFDERLFERYRSEKLISSELLRKDFNIEPISPNQNYIIFFETDRIDYFLFVPIPTIGPLTFKRIDKNALLESAKYEAKLTIMSFRFSQKQNLLNRLFLDRAGLKDCLFAFSQYCFFNKFALWIYNQYSKHFCCLVSSDTMTKEFVNEEDASPLYSFMKSDMDHEFREPYRECVNSDYAAGMKTLNRLRLELGKHEGIGVLDFFSSRKNYSLREDTMLMIKHHIESKYIEEKQSTLIALHKVEEYFSKYRPGQLKKSFLYNLTSIISKELAFQVCSIFENENGNGNLRLVAVTDSNQRGKPKANIVYDLTKKTFTGSAFKSEEGFLSSYDIANDNKNSHTYDEKTEGAGKTWIAYTLKAESTKWGILRVKNKHKRGNPKDLVNFTPTDFIILRSICTHLSNIFVLEKLYNETNQTLEDLSVKRELLKKSFEELKNFYNIFLHEIRTPISTLGSAPLRIISLLRMSQFNKDIKKTIELKVNDIHIMGERLAFIANTYYFKELVKSKKPEKLSVLKDIVIPVLNISKEYIKKQHGVEIILQNTSLEGYLVTGDKMLLNLVFNTLISNAGKYSDENGKPIKVFGEYDSDFEYFFICVSNYGLPIYEEEKERIFKDGERGRAVIEEKIGGTGIGLHLASEIMKKQNGSLILSSLRDPVIFKIKLPLCN